MKNRMELRLYYGLREQFDEDLLRNLVDTDYRMIMGASPLVKYKIWDHLCDEDVY